MTGATADGNRAASEVLIVDSVSRRFGSVTALDGVSLTVAPGSAVGVVGPNGSGKTTLLRIVAGLLAPSAGTVDRPDAPDRPVGYVPQHPSVRASLTVRETLSFYRSLLDESVAVDCALETVGLTGVGDRRVDALSGGMGQLLGLAIALLGDPPLVVLDEPTSGLDPANTRHIFGVVTGLADDGTAVLLTTHDLAHVDVVDEVVVLNEGQLVAQGPPTDLRERTDAATLVEVFHSMFGGEPAVQAGRTGQ